MAWEVVWLWSFVWDMVRVLEWGVLLWLVWWDVGRGGAWCMVRRWSLRSDMVWVLIWDTFGMVGTVGRGVGMGVGYGVLVAVVVRYGVFDGWVCGM